MISFNNLGRVGRLGNQMFQYAALKGIARRNGYEFCIPFSPELNEWMDHQLCKYFVLDDNLILSSPSQGSTWQERMFNFDEEFFNSCPDEVDIVGYFQTEKYFISIRDEILKDFHIKGDFERPANEYVAMHVRRGDYVTSQSHHPVCPVEYYEKALDIIDSRLPVLVVSDDIDWCKENVRADIYMSGTSNIEDLFIMTQASHNVIANSSFSWWGAWLNQNDDKIVVAPKTWFGPALAHHNTIDIVPDDWRRA